MVSNGLCEPGFASMCLLLAPSYPIRELMSDKACLSANRPGACSRLEFQSTLFLDLLMSLVSVNEFDL